MSEQTTPRIVFMGPLHPQEEEKQILAMSRIHPSSAPNVFQWELIHGMEEALGHPLEIINALPVGTWPGAYRKLHLPDRTWYNRGVLCHETGCINLPFLKQQMRASRAARLVKKTIHPGDHVLLYSSYMPYMKALAKLPKSITITVIITDLPEYYDLGKTTRLHRLLRKMQNRFIYRYMKRIDRFVLLTEQMQTPLQVGDRPWMLLEGICNAKPSPIPAETERAILYAGTLHRQFGIHNLAAAFRLMKDPEAKLWFCGSGDSEDVVRELCKDDPRATFFGFLDQDQVQQLRKRAALLVNPRTAEGEYTKYTFPSKTMEYLASGKPVVMHKLAGIPSSYDPYLFYPEDNSPEALCHTLQYVLDHPAEAAEKGRRAQAFVLENKSSTVQGRRVVEFLSK